MKLNDREIQIVEYDTSRNWIADFPNEKWLCIIVNNDRTREYIDEIARKIIEKDVCYVCATGKLSEQTHDLIDEEIVFREVDIEELYLPNHHIMTTWDNEIKEAIWFGIFAAHHDLVEISRIVILDLTNGKKLKSIKKALKNLEDERKSGI